MRNWVSRNGMRVGGGCKNVHDYKTLHKCMKLSLKNMLPVPKQVGFLEGDQSSSQEGRVRLNAG